MENSIKTQIELIKKIIYYAHENYLAVKNSCETDIQKLRDKCDHPETTFHSDPSGNNDSYFSCDVCGKEAKRL